MSSLPSIKRHRFREGALLSIKLAYFVLFTTQLYSRRKLLSGEPTTSTLATRKLPSTQKQPVENQSTCIWPPSTLLCFPSAWASMPRQVSNRSAVCSHLLINLRSFSKPPVLTYHPEADIKCNPYYVTCLENCGTSSICGFACAFDYC